MKMQKYLTIAFVALIIITFASFFMYSYMYKPHRNVVEEQTVAVLSAIELQNRFADANGSLESFADKIIEVNGFISNVEQQRTIIVDDKVQIDFDGSSEIEATLIKGNMIRVKGRCVGYDDLLEIVKIDQAILIYNY